MGSIIDKVRARAKAAQEVDRREVDIPLAKVRFDPNQPRKRYHVLAGQLREKDQQWIETLAANIEQQGQIQAITVEELPDGTFVVRIGECRTRACLHLGRKTIRAVINNSLQKRSTRLLYQLSENIARDDLEDYEIAETVKDLLAGDPENDDPPMNQTQIAKHLGFSEGWITRFVAFGNDELQKRWVETGIADTAEKVYRLKLLPMPMQLEILQRVDLPVGDPDHLPRPLNRSVIDDYATMAKREKGRKTEGTKGPAGAAPAAGAAASMSAAKGKGNGATDPSHETHNAGHAGGGERAGVANPVSSLAPAGGAGYQLPDELRNEILSQSAGPSPSAAKAAATAHLPPVNCRLELSSLEALLPLVKTKPELLKAVRHLRVEVTVPGEVARQVATMLAGVVVEDQELPATLQTELAKLG